MNNLVDCLGTENYEYDGGLVERMGFFGKTEKDIRELKETGKVSRRGLFRLGAATGIGAAAMTLGMPTDAQARKVPRKMPRLNRQGRRFEHPMPEGVRNSFPITQELFNRYQRFKGCDGEEEFEIFEIITCSSTAETNKKMREAYSFDPAIYYVVLLWDQLLWDGETSFWKQIPSNRDNISYTMATISRYFSSFVFKDGYPSKKVIDMGFKSISLFLYGKEDDNKLLTHINNSKVPNISRIKDSGYLKAALWSAAILSRTYRKEKNNYLADQVEELLENPLAKQVGYNIGNIL